jgi:hypothetical protein
MRWGVRVLVLILPLNQTIMSGVILQSKQIMSSPQSNLYQLNQSAVREALSWLCKSKVHTNFLGYLCLKRASRLKGTISELAPSFKKFFDTFLAVPGGPPNRPYVVPFSESGPGLGNIWFNKNVAGSYAPSSLRTQSPIRLTCDIATVDGVARYNLIEEHAAAAKTHLLFGGNVSAEALSIFFYRDYALQGDTPSLVDLIEIFRDEFGYRTSVADEEAQFSALFHIGEFKAPVSSELFVNG